VGYAASLEKRVQHLEHRCPTSPAMEGAR
jgi:hypothetical protein